MKRICFKCHRKIDVKFMVSLPYNKVRKGYNVQKYHCYPSCEVSIDVRKANVFLQEKGYSVSNFDREDIEINEPVSVLPNELPRRYQSSDGSVTKIDKYYFPLLDALIDQLTPIAKIEILQLTTQQLEDCLVYKKRSSLKMLIEILGKDWYWRDSGEPFPDTDTFKYLENNSQLSLLKRCRSKRTPSIKMIDAAIDFFTGNNAEVYWKEPI